ncbi:MAG: hypothetical protein ACLP3K_16675 [Candidatus Acidiferrales bacterium]
MVHRIHQVSRAEIHSYKGAVTCKNAATIIAVQSLVLDQRNDAWQNKQIIDTDWTYEPPAPAAPPGAQH